MAVSALIELDKFDDAAEILELYEDYSGKEAVYLYLDWYLEACMSEGESESLTLMLKDAIAANPFVDELLEQADLPKLPFPRSLDVTSGSMEEAMYIWTLL